MWCCMPQLVTSDSQQLHLHLSPRCLPSWRMQPNRIVMSEEVLLPTSGLSLTIFSPLKHLFNPQCYSQESISDSKAYAHKAISKQLFLVFPKRSRHCPTRKPSTVTAPNHTFLRFMCVFSIISTSKKALSIVRFVYDKQEIFTIII